MSYQSCWAITSESNKKNLETTKWKQAKKEK